MNEHISDYLDHYINLKKPKFAVMINGKWGAGKTRFINNFFNERPIREKKEIIIDGTKMSWIPLNSPKTPRFLYASLNGISDLRDIEVQFLQQLYPKIDNDVSRLSGKLFSGLLKTTLNIDLNSKTPIPEFLLNLKNRVLVFDDLERCRISIDEIFGYINQLVEHEEQHVIVIGYEKKITDNENNDIIENSLLKEIKEKIIGRTFFIKPDFDSAFSSFLNIIDSQILKKLLQNNRKHVKSVFLSSETDNLRILRNGISELKQLLDYFDRNYTTFLNNEKFIQEFITYFFVLHFELKGDGKTLTIESLNNLSMSVISDLFNTSEEKSKEQELRETYPEIEFSNPPIKDQFWYDFFKLGNIKNSYLDPVLDSSRYFNVKEPLWIKLWNMYELTDKEFENIIKLVREKYRNKDFNSLTEIIHITASLLSLSKKGLITESKRTISDSSIKIVRKLFREEKLKVDLVTDYFRIDNFYSGYSFTDGDSPEFKQFSKRVRREYKIARKFLIEDHANQLLKTLEGSTEEFSQLISRFSDKDYHLIPILKLIDETKFIEIFKTKSPKEKGDILVSFIARLRLNSFTSDERKWISEVIKSLRQEYPVDKRSIESIMLNERFDLVKDQLK